MIKMMRVMAIALVVSVTPHAECGVENIVKGFARTASEIMLFSPTSPLQNCRMRKIGSQIGRYNAAFIPLGIAGGSAMAGLFFPPLWLVTVASIPHVCIAPIRTMSVALDDQAESGMGFIGNFFGGLKDGLVAPLFFPITSPLQDCKMVVIGDQAARNLAPGIFAFIALLLLSQAEKVGVPDIVVTPALIVSFVAGILVAARTHSVVVNHNDENISMSTLQTAMKK